MKNSFERNINSAHKTCFYIVSGELFVIFFLAFYKNIILYYIYIYIFISLYWCGIQFVTLSYCNPL